MRVWVAIVALVLFGACSSNNGMLHERAGPQLPSAVLHWLRDYAHNSGLGRATSADWVLTTHDKSGPYVGDAGFPDRTPVYLVDMHGHFVWNHSCPAPGPACTSTGIDAVFTVDARHPTIVDLGVGNDSPDFAKLGPVGHLAL